MAVERADLSSNLSLEQTLPVAAAQGQAAPEGGPVKPRRRPPRKEAPAESAEEGLDQGEPDKDESNRTAHRIDSLA